MWAVSDSDAETEMVPTDPKTEGKGDAIHVQSVQKKLSQMIRSKPNVNGSNPYFGTKNILLSHNELLMGIPWSNLHPGQCQLFYTGRFKCSPTFKKN